MIEILAIIVLMAIDQASKAYMANILKHGGRTIPIIKSVFYLTYVENRGSAFGLMQGKKVILIGVTALVLAIILYFIITNKFKNKIYNLGWTLIVAGGLGNLVDRVLKGYVVDFLYFSPINFPVFNFADICVTTGAALVIIYVIFLESRVAEKTAIEGEQSHGDLEENIPNDKEIKSFKKSKKNSESLENKEQLQDNIKDKEIR